MRGFAVGQVSVANTQRLRGWFVIRGGSPAGRRTFPGDEVRAIDAPPGMAEALVQSRKARRMGHERRGYRPATGRGYFAFALLFQRFEIAQHLLANAGDRDGDLALGRGLAAVEQVELALPGLEQARRLAR